MKILKYLNDCSKIKYYYVIYNLGNKYGCVVLEPLSLKPERWNSDTLRYPRFSIKNTFDRGEIEQYCSKRKIISYIRKFKNTFLVPEKLRKQYFPTHGMYDIYIELK